jgi:hypothetical protein
MLTPEVKNLIAEAGIRDNWNPRDWYSISPEMLDALVTSIIAKCADAAMDAVSDDCLYVYDYVLERLGYAPGDIP